MVWQESWLRTCPILVANASTFIKTSQELWMLSSVTWLSGHTDCHDFKFKLSPVSLSLSQKLQFSRVVFVFVLLLVRSWHLICLAKCLKGQHYGIALLWCFPNLRPCQCHCQCHCLCHNFCLFVSSVRSSSGYHGLIEIRAAATFSNLSNSSDSKVKVKVKGPNMCYIFEKHGIRGYQIWHSRVSNVKYTNTRLHKYANTQIQSA